MQKPFSELGGELRSIRQGMKESVAEVSGAVEIDTVDLEKIEDGQQRPSEDVLMLLISHFGVHDDKAVELWQLAGYDQPGSGRDQSQDFQNKTVMLMMTLDTRILYSDNVNITNKRGGLVVNFMQSSGMGNQEAPVARIGMSYEQANDLMKSLYANLNKVASDRRPKSLPSPKQHHKNRKPEL